MSNQIEYRMNFHRRASNIVDGVENIGIHLSLQITDESKRLIDHQRKDSLKEQVLNPRGHK